MPPLSLLHVVISLIGIIAGVFAVRGFVANRYQPATMATFLWSTVATSVTGFLFFPLQPFTPAHVFGVLSLVVLGPSLFALYARRFRGPWRKVFVISSVFAFYLNFFVLIVQAFRRVPALHALAPTESELPFAVAQLIALVVFIFLGVRSVARFRVEPLTA